MPNYWKLVWQRLFSPDLRDKAEIEQLAVLQQAAARRRADYAERKEHYALTGDTSLHSALSASRQQMEGAENAHTAALQIWENKQSRQKSR